MGCAHTLYYEIRCLYHSKLLHISLKIPRCLYHYSRLYALFLPSLDDSKHQPYIGIIGQIGYVYNRQNDAQTSFLGFVRVLPYCPLFTHFHVSLHYFYPH